MAFQLKTDPLSVARDDARRGLHRHFNRLAAESLHDDILALADGKNADHPIRVRHAQLTRAMNLVETANTLEEIDDIVTSVGIVSSGILTSE